MFIIIKTDILRKTLFKYSYNDYIMTSKHKVKARKNIKDKFLDMKNEKIFISIISDKDKDIKSNIMYLRTE